MKTHPRSCAVLAAFLTLLTFALSFPAGAQTAGALDETFNPNVTSAPNGGYVTALAVQPDGKTVIGGQFIAVGGMPHLNVARINADGTVDESFVASANAFVGNVIIQADGQILLGGNFTQINNVACPGVARVNPDGSLEDIATFHSGLGPDFDVSGMALQADGKIVLGDSSPPTPDTRPRLVRLNSDGSLESTTTFNPGTGANSSIYSIAVQADGQILIGGSFTQVNGMPRNGIARLNTDGSLEGTATFNPGADRNSTVFSIAQQADGKIVLGGWPYGGSGFHADGAFRLNADGSLDESFHQAFTFIKRMFSLALQTNGKILIGGDRNYFDPNAPGFTRLNSDGTRDIATFALATGADDASGGIAIQANGKILFSGNFDLINGLPRHEIARLENDPVAQSLTAWDATEVQWRRGGASPEVSPVTFELLADGGNVWSVLGTGTRMEGGWRLSGLNLPANGVLRARGRTTSGFGNGSSGLLETVQAYTLPTSLHDWKLVHLGDADAPNAGDPDFDGLANILEYATGADPLTPGPLPGASTIGNTTALTFSRYTIATDVTLTVQGSDDLLTWTDLASSVNGADMVALVAGVTVNETGASALRTVEVRDLYPIGDPAHPQRFLRLQAAPTAAEPMAAVAPTLKLQTSRTHRPRRR